MNGHVTAKLGAYHDGELGQRQARPIEAHLAECVSCRAELATLRQLSALLAESPAPLPVTSPARFVAQVGLRLPRRPRQTAWQRALWVAWRLAPAGLLGAWAFVQATSVVVRAALLARQVGLDGGVLNRLWPAASGTLWLESALGHLGVSLSVTGRAAMHFLSTYSWSIAWSLALPGLIALLYWSWLASLWAHYEWR